MKWLLVVVIIYLALSRMFSIDPGIENCSPIVKVGGCDRYGNCTVRLENGRIQNSQMAVEGNTVCYYKGGGSVTNWRWLFLDTKQTPAGTKEN